MIYYIRPCAVLATFTVKFSIVTCCIVTISFMVVTLLIADVLPISIILCHAIAFTCCLDY